MISCIRKHWWGEYSLPRAYWLNGIIIGILLLIPAALILEDLKQARQDAVSGEQIVEWLILLGGILCFTFVVHIWQTVGIWRSATLRGGFWAGAAKVTVVLAWISSFTNAERGFSPTGHYANTQSSNTPVSVAAPALPHRSQSAQHWGDVGDWSIDYDYSDAGGGIPNGCFMARSYDNGFLRVGYYEPIQDYMIVLADSAWNTSLEEDRRYTINLQLGNELPWTVETRVVVFPDTKLKVWYSSQINRNSFQN